MGRIGDKEELATVDPIRPETNWGARAAIGDALSRCPDDADMICIWMGKDDKLYWSSSGSRQATVYLMSAAIHKVIFE